MSLPECIIHNSAESKSKLLKIKTGTSLTWLLCVLEGVGSNMWILRAKLAAICIGVRKDKTNE